MKMSILESDLFYLEVLPRLPLKSLIRLKCVSKILKAAISSPEFAQLYLRRQFLCPDTSDLLVLPGHRQINCYDLDSPPLLPAAATFAWNDSWIWLVSVVGSSNGLLCLMRNNYNLILLNPSTRICRVVGNLNDRAHVTNIGFAFDHVNHDFKIVVVNDRYNKSALNTRTTQIYSLNFNAWRMVEATMHEDSMEGRNGGGVLINNHLLHWMFWRSSTAKRRIGCFDVCSENWKDDVLLPAYYYDPRHKNYLLDIGVLDGCLFSSFENRVDSSFDVWVMKEYGVQDSWLKLLSIPVSDDLEGGIVPIACHSGSTVVLIRQRHKARLLWYNRLDNGLTDEAAIHLSPHFAKLQAYTCMRSLVTLPGGMRFEELDGASGEERIV